MGRRKTPTERMAARSPDGKTPGKRDLAVPAKVVADRSIPDPPVTLYDRGAAEWYNIWAAGYWLKRDQDYRWVEMICRSYQDIGIFRERVEADGLVVTGYAGQVVAHPLIKAIRECEATIQKCLSILGFSPSDRARLQLTEAKTASKLQSMIDGSR